MKEKGGLREYSAAPLTPGPSSPVTLAGQCRGGGDTELARALEVPLGEGCWWLGTDESCPGFSLGTVTPSLALLAGKDLQRLVCPGQHRGSSSVCPELGRLCPGRGGAWVCVWGRASSPARLSQSSNCHFQAYLRRQVLPCHPPHLQSSGDEWWEKREQGTSNARGTSLRPRSRGHCFIQRDLLHPAGHTAAPGSVSGTKRT